MTDERALRTFQALGQYDWPSLPAEDALQRLWHRLRDAVIESDPDEPLVAGGDLDGMTSKRLDAIAAPPACGPLLEEMTATFADWLSNPDQGRPLQLVVMPPCDEAGIVRAWAEENDLSILLSPPRTRIGSGEGTALCDSLSEEIVGDGVLVIPALEAWFLRTADGLAAVRALLSALGRSERRCLIGCNSWAWTYLCRAVDAGSLLPTGLTFQAFDGPRLQAWFRQLQQDTDAIPARFRLSGSGVDVFEGDATGRQDYFVQLAARSLGIPWIAWQMWRDAIRDLPDPEEAARSDEMPGGDGKTFWITSPETFTLSVGREEDTLLTLQALLLHGPMDDVELRRVLPVIGERNTVPALLQSDVITRVSGRLACNPVAYPSVREALSDAGFNLDRL